jgi:hypothetical protein
MKFAFIGFQTKIIMLTIYTTEGALDGFAFYEHKLVM